MAIAQNIIIDQDADYSQQFEAKTDAGVVIDLTGSSIGAQVRKSFASTSSTAFTTAIVSATLGTFTLALTDVQSAALERGRHVYDVRVTDTTSTITRIQEGVATVSPSVTR